MSTSALKHEAGHPPSDIDAEVIDLYARSANRYDRLNMFASLGTSNWYRRRTILSLDLPSNARVVDVGTGTGALSLAAQRFLPDSPSIVAVDPCPEMRELARRSGVRDVREGSFEAIPVDDASFDVLVSGYAIRYARDLDRAFSEIRRVLVPGGRVVLLEMIAPRSRTGRRAGRIFIHNFGAPFLGVFCGGSSIRDLMRHFWDSVSSFESPEGVVNRMEAAGFVEVEYRPAGGLLGEFRAKAPDA